MIGVGRHALIEVAGIERQDDRAYSRQVVDAKLARSIECAGCGADLTGLYQGFDDCQLAVRGAFFYMAKIT